MNNLKYILSGSNSATEGIPMPSNWAKMNKLDYKNIKNIWKKFGFNYSLKTFPGYGFADYIYDKIIKRTIWLSFLDYVGYNKAEALKVLSEDYSYKPYPYKHYESIFTRFYQGYILPKKFKVDKRKNHLSALVLNGEINREDAINMLKNSPYPNNDDLDLDLNYFLKKFDWTMDDLNNYLEQPEIKHKEYGSENYLFDFYYKLLIVYRRLRSLN